MATQFTLPRQVKINVAGRPYAGAQAFFYQTETEVAQSVYQDSGLTVLHPQPVVADDDGYFPMVWLDENAAFDYRVRIVSAAGSLLDDVSDIPPRPMTAAQVIHDVTTNLDSLKITEAEVAASVTPANFAYTALPIIDVRRYGIIANNSLAATANTAALKALCNPAIRGPVGHLYFPNISGNAIYYFNDVIPLRDGTYIDLDGSTLAFSKTATASDTGSGWLFGIRDIAVENGSITVNYNPGATTSSGNAIQLGSRGDDSAYFPNCYDSVITNAAGVLTPQGNFKLHALRITSNVTGDYGAGIALLGGISGLDADTIFIEGGGVLSAGISYEFGWATSGTTNLRQTSHANGMKFRNIFVNNLGNTGQGIQLTGAYNCLIENLKVLTAGGAFGAGPGEALFYRPWSGHDATGSKRQITLRNIVGAGLRGPGITLGGVGNASLTYLSAIIGALSATDQSIAQTDLGDFVLDGFAIQGNNKEDYGIKCSAGYADIRNGHIFNCIEGVRLTDECTRFNIQGLRVLDNAATGINLNGGEAFWSPKRLKVGSIRGCHIAGNGTASPGTAAAIYAENTQSVLIEGNRFGYETGLDGKSETMQNMGVQQGTNVKGLICRANHTSGVTGSGAAAYYTATNAPNATNGNTVELAMGVTSQTGTWLNLLKGFSPDRGDAGATLTVGSDFENQLFATTLTANRSVAINTTNAVKGSRFRIVRTGLGAFSIDVGGLKTMPNSTAAFVEIVFDGTAWKLAAYGTL